MSDEFKDKINFKQWNEEMARKYDPDAYHLHSNFLIRWIEHRRVKTILQFLDTTNDDIVLEVGCGAGNVLEQIRSDHLYGIDLSIFLLKKAHKRLADYRAGLCQANGECLPFPKRKFHKLVCTEVLEHVFSPRKVVREMARVATSNAVLVISVPNEIWIDRVKSLLSTLGLDRWLLKGGKDAYSSPKRMTDEWHLHSFDIDLILNVTANILHIDDIEAVPFRFLPLRYVVKCSVIQKRNSGDII